MKRVNRQMKMMLMIFFKKKKKIVEQLGKSYSVTLTFKCWGSTAAVLVLIKISHLFMQVINIVSEQ